jgi:ornithine--oxo-acid transaminase
MTKVDNRRRATRASVSISASLVFGNSTVSCDCIELATSNALLSTEATDSPRVGSTARVILGQTSGEDLVLDGRIQQVGTQSPKTVLVNFENVSQKTLAALHALVQEETQEQKVDKIAQNATESEAGATSDYAMKLVDQYSAHNYHPLEVVVAKGEGVWVEDPEGKRYLDMLAAYSAVNFGHGHPGLIGAAKAQLDRVTLTSRAFHNDQLGLFCQELAELCGQESVLPMNTGAEAVETAIKTARKWGYTKKGVPADQAKIIVCDGNFHGRTTTIVSFSTDPQARDGFGPFTPGFEVVPYGDLEALEQAIDEDTVGFLVEPIQGEGGVVIPPDGFLKEALALCQQKQVLFIADEIQAGLGRSGRTFACDWEDVKPDILILGKALGGGIMPISAVVSSREIMSVFKPGDHGSTFGGNPLACAVAREAIRILQTHEVQRNAFELGAYMREELDRHQFSCIKEIRSRGLWFGIELHTDRGGAHKVCQRLMKEGILAKGTHEHTIRLAPPLVISHDECDWALERLTKVLADT